MKKNVKNCLKIIMLFFVLMVLVFNVNSLAEYEEMSSKNVQDLVGEYENTSSANLDLLKTNEVASETISNEEVSEEMIPDANSPEVLVENIIEPLKAEKNVEENCDPVPVTTYGGESNVEYKGTNSPTYVSTEQQMRNINFILACYIVVLVLIILLFAYFIGKICNYFRLNNQYKKDIAEGKEVEKPEIKIKIKYIILLVLILDVILFGLVYVTNLYM